MQIWTSFKCLLDPSLISTQNYLAIRYVDRFWYTQNIPTHKSANARLARQKFVMDRILQCKVTTRITIKFPGKTDNKIHQGSRTLPCQLYGSLKQLCSTKSPRPEWGSLTLRIILFIVAPKIPDKCKLDVLQYLKREYDITFYGVGHAFSMNVTRLRPKFEILKPPAHIKFLLHYCKIYPLELM